MADLKKKYADNAPGEFFVDENCIYCGLCADLAPANFKLSSGCDHDYVYAQPKTKEERTQCLLALDTCPVEAIGREEPWVNNRKD